MSKIFVFIDVSKKQEFIFKSNKLKDNLKNSYIIKSITEYDDSENYNDMKVSLNEFIKRYEAKKVFCGGGNSIIGFIDNDKAKKFIREYSRKVLETYPDLELYISKIERENDGEFSIEDKKFLSHKANKLKEKRRSRYEKISFGVEKLDGETGFPIHVKEDSIHCDKVIINKAKKNLKSILNLSKEASIEITSELGDYKGKDKMSYIGIISLDGNGMGKLVDSCQSIKELHNLSNDIRDIYYQSISEYLEKLSEYNNENIKKYITPIISAGDDLCLILDGRIAIDAAANIIKNIKKKSKESEIIKKKMPNGLTTCAGIAIVKAGYPFFDGYREAEKLCKKSKIYLHKIKDDKEYLSFMDWKIVQGSNIESGDFIENIKEKDEIYHIKPLIIDDIKSYFKEDKEAYIFSYLDFKELKKDMEDMILNKKISKSTLKKLQESFYDGYESYKIDIDNRRKEYTEELFSAISKTFSSNNDYGVIETSTKERIYILNDIIDAFNFLITID
ncbi:Cas10/Cmr2 second palm domain-containing protein [Clostridiisalibacter paucivorans]|uniref:Cas10/Cmr2 second palm domain-containing protein n=1 Tax=Clostridiisalibacter paucivorans TaxID=408753 RepID=UPI00047E07F2|nr:hypothetical protein [Clostridiisalibacter paucivorans]